MDDESCGSTEETDLISFVIHYSSVKSQGTEKSESRRYVPPNETTSTIHMYTNCHLVGHLDRFSRFCTASTVVTRDKHTWADKRHLSLVLAMRAKN